MTSERLTATGERATRVCTVAGVILGGLWALQHGESLWEHAVRFGILLFVVAPLGMWLLRRRRVLEGSPLGGLHLGRLMVAKGLLLVVALAVSVVLRPLTPAADYLVAAGLFAAVTFLGPLLLPWLLAGRVLHKPHPGGL